MKLEHNSFLYNSLKYLGINNCIVMTNMRVYNNALMENAMLFQLFESLILDHEKTYEKVNQKCETCNRDIQLGIKKRIQRFVLDIGINNDSILKSINKIADTRHSFFHSLNGLSKLEYSENIIYKTNKNEMNLEDDLKHGQGVFMAQGLLKAIITIYLLNKLLNIK